MRTSYIVSENFEPNTYHDVSGPFYIVVSCFGRYDSAHMSSSPLDRALLTISMEVLRNAGRVISR